MATWKRSLVVSMLLAAVAGGCGQREASEGRRRTDSSESNGGTGGSDGSPTYASDPTQALQISTPEGTRWEAALLGEDPSGVRTIVLRNGGDVTLGVAAQLAGDDAADFTIAEDLATSTLVANEMAQLRVRFTPKSSGKKFANVQVRVDRADDPRASRLEAVPLEADAKPWSYVGARGISPGSAGSFLLPEEPGQSSHRGRPGDRSVALAVDGSAVYLAYKDGTKPFDPSDPESGRVTVEKFEQGDWSVLGARGFSEGDAMWISLAVCDGVPYVVYEETLGPSASPGATMMKFDGNAWVLVGLPRFTRGGASMSALHVIDADEAPEFLFSYRDENARLELDGADRRGAVSVMQFSAGNWRYLGQPSFTYPDVTKGPTSVVLANGVPYVSYDRGLVRYEATSASWVRVASFEATATALLTNAAGEIFLGVADGPYESKASVFGLVGSELVALGARGFSNGPADFLSLGWIGDSVVLAYRDGGTYQGVTGGAVVVQSYGGGWDMVGGGTASTGAVSHLALGIAGSRVVLGYKDDTLLTAPTALGTGRASVISLP